MEDNIWLKVGTALLLIMVLWRVGPAAMHWMKNGPKGTSQDWMGLMVPLAAVVGFVLLLIMMVRG